MAYGQHRIRPMALAELIPVFKHQLIHCRVKDGERLVAVTDSDGETLLQDDEFVPDALRAPKP